MSHPPIVLLHGVWLPAVAMSSLARRLQTDHGRSCHLFGYPSVREGLDANAARLAAFVAQIEAERIGIIGHSLGGIVALRMLARSAPAKVHRLVCLGSPLMGSLAAKTLYKRNWGKTLIGRSLASSTVESRTEEWASQVTADYEVGVIAGHVAAGLGQALTSFSGDNDGTVSVEETRLPGIRDHLVLPVSHTGMLFSNRIAEHAVHFLDNGQFNHES